MKVSIIIPAYNAVNTLPICLKSIIRQNYPSRDLEVLIINDGSTDGTPEIIQQLTLPGNIQLYTHQKNRGLAAARNTGIRHARGDVLIFLDADMEIPPDFIQEHLTFHQRKQVIGVLSAIAPAPDCVYDKYQRYLHEGRRGALKYPASEPLPHHVFLFGCTSIKKSALGSVGLFDENITHYGGEDTEYAYRLWQAFPRGLFYAPTIRIVHHHYHSIGQALRNFESFGKNVVPYLINKNIELGGSLGNTCKKCLSSDKQYFQNTICNLLVSHPVRHLLLFLYRIAPYPVSNQIVRMLIASALFKGLSRRTRNPDN
jgi:glycosyltransferase involved in cell wall biosynthesis